MLKTKKITEVFGLPVYTDEGDYYGEVEELTVSSNKLSGWRIRATKNSQLSKVLSGAKGVTIPHQLIRAVGDIVIISRGALPVEEEQKTEGQM